MVYYIHKPVTLINEQLDITEMHPSKQLPACLLQQVEDQQLTQKRQPTPLL